MSTNHWLRLWHDMPNDPKFRTIARISDQPISLVLSVYMHLLVDASRNVTRGHVCVTTEDLASALDVTEQQIESIFDAMDGRLKDGDYLSGWEKRQPKKEDAGNEQTGAKSAAERKAAQRERERLAREAGEKTKEVTDCHGESRNVTLEERRGEERRGEKSIKEANASLAATPPPATDESKPEKQKAGKRATALPEDFAPNDTGRAYAEAKGVNADVELLSFRNWHGAKGSTMKDWQAAWRTWCDKAVVFGRVDGGMSRPKNLADVAHVTVSDGGAAEKTKAMLADREQNTAPPSPEIRARIAALRNAGA